MTPSEKDVLGFFRRYQVGPTQMLFFNPGDCKLTPSDLRAAMRCLIEKGLVIKERPEQAYSLTRAGYERSLRVGRETAQRAAAATK